MMPEKWWTNLASVLMTMGYAMLNKKQRAIFKTHLELGRQFAQANPGPFRAMCKSTLNGEPLDIAFKRVSNESFDSHPSYDEERALKCEPRRRHDNPWSESVN